MSSTPTVHSVSNQMEEISTKDIEKQELNPESASSPSSSNSHDMNDSLSQVDSQNGTLSTLPDSNVKILIACSFADWVFSSFSTRYTSVKQSSKFFRFFANSTETVLGKTGVLYITRLLFNQWMSLGAPLASKMDEKIGEEILHLFVKTMLLAGQESTGNMEEEVAICSYRDRVKFLLSGNPTVIQSTHEKQLKEDIERLSQKCESYTADISRMEQATQQQQKNIYKLHKEKEELDQQLTDVHNFTASERGQRYQELEREHAELKLQYVEEKSKIKELERMVKKLKRDRKSLRNLHTPPKSVPTNENTASNQQVFFNKTP